MSKRTLCIGSWPPPRTRFQPFPVCHDDGFTDGKHQKRSTSADDVRGRCGAVRKGEMRAGVGTGAVEGSIGEERNESVKRTQCGWNNWRKMAGVLCDKRIPLHVKGNIHKMIVQSAIGPTVRDGDSANDQHPSEENGSDRDEEDCLDGHAATH